MRHVMLGIAIAGDCRPPRMAADREAAKVSYAARQRVV